MSNEDKWCHIKQIEKRKLNKMETHEADQIKPASKTTSSEIEDNAMQNKTKQKATDQTAKRQNEWKEN